MQSLESLCHGRRVLIINAIHRGRPSGGATATACVLAGLGSAATSLKTLEMWPQGESRLARLAFGLTTFPGSLFVAMERRFKRPWLEFFTRLSPALALICLWYRWRYHPEVVVLNHHATLLYGALFPAARMLQIWHDVPSIKQVPGRSRTADSRWCAMVERRLLRRAPEVFTFSFDDQRVLRRLHHISAQLVPAVGESALVPLPAHREADLLLLVANWGRRENTDGAQAFAFALATHPEGRPLRILMAGYGALQALARLERKTGPHLGIEWQAVEGYDHLGRFTAAALVAPLLSGAGIKVKTLEAWAAGLPVLGTEQAFTGLRPDLWRTAGLRFPSIEALARFCRLGPLQERVKPLQPRETFQRYLRGARSNPSTSASRSITS
jgi:hypothetical protein